MAQGYTFCDYFTLVSSAQFSSVQFSSLFFGHPQFCEVAARGKEGRVRRPLEAQRQILCARVTCIQTHNLLSITSTPNSNHSIFTATMKERYRHRVNVSTRNAAINLPDIRGQPSSWVALILFLLTWGWICHPEWSRTPVFRWILSLHSPFGKCTLDCWSGLLSRSLQWKYHTRQSRF